MINADDMQSWAYLLAPTFQFVNTAGKPLTEGWIEVYIAGTRDKYYCASDFNGTLHPFQIPLDSLGANIVLADPDQAYDVYVYNKYGSLIMSRYHVSPGMAGGSGVLNITITSEDGTVSVNNDGNGNFDLSIQDTVDRIDVLEQTVSGLSANSSVGYAIAHAYTVELDGSFDLISDAVTGIGYTPNMDGFRLKSGHVYQFNFNALFENGAFDRNCSGKLYLEGPNTIAQEWKFDLDDSYYHSQSINGSTVLVTPNDLNYYDVKLKLAWDVDYPNKPNVDLNKISIVDITTILSTTVSGVGGNYTGGDGIFVNDETYVISVDMDYINSHLNIDASEIIASAVNIATAYTDARVTSVSGDLVNLIAEVSASIPTAVEQVQSDWNEQDSSSPAYINNKPDLSVYATNASLTAVSSVLQSEIDAISGAIPTDYVTHDEVSAVSGNIIEYVNSVSGDLVETINNVSGDIIHTVETVSGDIIETITTVSGDIIETVNNVSGDIIHTVESVSGDLVEIIETATANIPEQVNADWDAVSGKAEILNKPDLSVYATHEEVSGVSAVLNERINNVSGDLIETITTVSGDIINTVETVSAVLEGDIVSAIQVATGAIPEQVNADWDAVSGKAEILNKPDLSIYATHDELVDAVTAVSSMIPTDYVTHNEVSAVSANLVNYVNSVSGDITNYVDESIVSAINVATGSFEQVQSDWTEDDTNDPAYIKNKPNEIEIVAGQNIGIFSDATTITIAASATDLSDYATHSDVSAVSASIVNQIPDISGLATRTEVNNVSGVLETEIQIVSAAIGEQVPNVSIQSPSGTLVVTETVSGNNKIYSIDVAPTTGIEYGQFYATNITGAATMARTKGNIDITNDGKIKLKKGQSYHITVRGRYNQSVLKDNYSYASYIEYVTNNSININVDESRSGSQYFELSYDLFKLNSDTDYYVFFTLDDATVNDLFIDVHSLANVGGNGSSGGSSPEYDAGYGIQILNNVISVSGIAPQVQSDWNQTNTSSVDYIKNKPEEYGLLAGDNISITASGNNFIISSTASSVEPIDYQAGYGIDITGDTISVDASIIPSTSAYATKQELVTVSGMIPDISGLATNADLQIVSAAIPDVSSFATKSEVATASGTLNTKIDNVSAAIPELPSEEEVEFEELDLSDYALASAIPDVSNLATKTELATVSASIPDISGLATEAELQIVSAAIPDTSNLATKSELQIVSAAIPDVSNFVTEPTVSAIVDAALVDVPSGVSGVVAGDGISITASGSNYVISCSVTGTGDVSRADLASVSGILESQIQTVSGAIPDTSNLATKTEVQAVETNVQIVSAAIPTLPDEEEVEFEEIDLSDYALASAIPDVSQFATHSEVNTVSGAIVALIPDTSSLASKSEVNAVSGTLQTEIGAISGAMVDVPTGVSGVVAGEGIAITASGSDYIISCTVTGGGSSYTAGDYISIDNNTISVTGLDNSNIFWVTNSSIQKDVYAAYQAGKQLIYTDSDKKQYLLGNVAGNYFYFYALYADIYTYPANVIYYVITASSSSTSVVSVSSGTYSLQADWNETIQFKPSYIQNKPDLTTYATKTEVQTVSATLESEIQTVSAVLDSADIPTGVSGLVAGENITITASGSNYVISGQAGGSIYSAGTGINITNDVISIDNTVALKSDIQVVSGSSGIAVNDNVVSLDNPIGLVAGNNITITVSGTSAVISSQGGGGGSSYTAGTGIDITNDVISIDNTVALKSEVQTVSAAIPTLPTEEEVDFEEVDLSDYALASAIPTLADLNTQGITDIQVVQTLPVSPVSSVLYLIPET